MLNPLPDRSYFLVIGAPRSGTTLLAAMIGRHTEVGIVNQETTGTWVRKILSKEVVGNKLCVPNEIQLKRKRNLRARWLKKLGLIVESPRSGDSIEDYLQIPSLKIIAIVRDGNDTISSNMKRSHKNWKRAARRWEEAIETIHELNAGFPERTLVINFEELVMSPRAVLEALCRFLGLAFQDQMLDGYKYNPSYTEEKLNEQKVHRWKKEKVDFQLAVALPSAYAKYRELAAAARVD